jgi:hypothetical protein
MQGYAIVAFAVFFACCVGQFWFMKRVRDALIERHPDTFLAVQKSLIFPDGGLRRFLRKGRYKDLNDPELDKRVRDLKRLYLIAIAAWLAYGISLFTDPIFRH